MQPPRPNRTIHSPVITGQCDSHHRGNGKCAITNNRALLASTDSQNGPLRRVDHGGKFPHAKHAKIGDGEAAAGKFLGREAAGARARRQIAAAGLW